MHNVEKSKFQKGQYVGYGGGAVWHIRNYGKGNWKATPQGNNKHQVFSCATLRDVSTQLETLNKNYSDEWRLASLASERKANPAPRKYRGKYPRRIASTSSAVKDGVYVFVLNDGTSHRVATRDLIAAGYQKQAPQPGEDFDFVLTALEATRKANPAKRPVPKKRAVSRPSQITKKAPTKRLVARRKIAAKKPVKGYFPNPLQEKMSVNKGKANFPYLVQRQNTENWNTSAAFKTKSEAFIFARELAAKYPRLPVRVMHYTGGPM